MKKKRRANKMEMIEKEAIVKQYQLLQDVDVDVVSVKECCFCQRQHVQSVFMLVLCVGCKVVVKDEGKNPVSRLFLGTLMRRNDGST